LHCIREGMTKSFIKITDKKEFKPLTSLIQVQKEPDGLMKLILDHNFEFNLNLSSRMLNYYETDGFIRFHREGEVGKRRFSLANAMGFKFSQYLKRAKNNKEVIAQINTLLNAKDENGISDWDRVVYIGSVTLGIHEIWIKKYSNDGPPSGKDILIELFSSGQSDFFYLSKQIRDTFFNEQGEVILRGKNATFLPQYMHEIDKIRDVLGWEKIFAEAFDNIKVTKGNAIEQYANSNAISAINVNPEVENKKAYDIIHEDEYGNYYGIDIQLLNRKSVEKIRYTKHTKKTDEIIEALEDEMRFLQRMREKLSRVS
jgi:hypothetical protein